MVFIWVSQHQSIKSNEMDDEYPVIGSSLNETSTCYDIQTPFVNIANKFVDWALYEITTRWSTIETSISVALVSSGPI